MKPPPRSANWLLAVFLPRRDREMLLGDLIEEYGLLVCARGPRSADRWYWIQVLRSAPPLLWANIRRGIWLKTIGAMLVSYLAVAVIVMIGDVLMAKLLSGGALVYPVASLAIGFSAMMLGGYLAACMRPRAPMLLAGFSAAMGVVSLAATGDAAPLWYQIALIVIAPVASLIGGRIRIRRKEGFRG